MSKTGCFTYSYNKKYQNVLKGVTKVILQIEENIHIQK